MASFRVRGLRNRGRSRSRSTYRRASPATTTSRRPSTRRRLGPSRSFLGLGRLTPFVIDLARHRLKGPDPLRSKRYANDVNFLEVYGRLHDSSRTPDQTNTAFFWFEPFAIWNDIATTVLQREQASPWRAARVLALMNFAIADAGIACFDAKYHFRFWRPYTAIRRASEDGNDETEPDPEWLPLLWTPPGEPLTVPHSADSRLSIRGRHDVGRGRGSVDDPSRRIGPLRRDERHTARRHPALQELFAGGARSRHVARLWRDSFRPRRRRRLGGRKARRSRRRSNAAAASAMITRRS